MRKKVTTEEPSPLERLLVERVVATRLRIQLFRILCKRHMFDHSANRGHQKRLDRAYRRYLAAIHALATVRKLLKPAVAQINIAEQRVNMGGNPTSEICTQIRSRRS